MTANDSPSTCQLLSGTSPLDGRWRAAAERKLAELDEELALARAGSGQGGARPSLRTADFHLRYDHAFAGRAYGDQVIELLEGARDRVRETLGRTLGRPLEVHVYTRGHYLEQYRHRFGFATVGFYDGAIHAVSSRQPRRDLLALLAHEYVHAVFKETLGTHRPFFVNEGIAEREEDRIRGRPRLPRGEWRRLLDALRERSWIPLSELVPGFGTLQGKRAQLAYLESRAAIEFLEGRYPGFVARWLGRCDAGERWERALQLETGWLAGELDAALREDVQSRFPPDPLA